MRPPVDTLINRTRRHVVRHVFIDVSDEAFGSSLQLWWSTYILSAGHSDRAVLGVGLRQLAC